MAHSACAAAMPRKPRNHIDELRGATKLAVEATKGVAALVEKMHVTIASGPLLLGQPLAIPARLATRGVYASIQGIAQLVGTTLDAALAQLAPLVEASAPGIQRDAIISVLNGVLGDYLHETANPLAIEMELRHAGRTLELTPTALREAIPTATSKILVLVHGSSMTDAQFTRAGHDHGAELARDLGYTPIYVRYNSGLHISTNGHGLAALLEQLATAWPLAIDELALLGHSMGGLVARSAIASTHGDTWRNHLRALCTLGTPHHGAPLERGGNTIARLLDLTPYTSPLGALGRIRSAGVTDLRYGNVRDEHWHGRDRFAHGRDPRSPTPLPDGVRCYAIAGTLSTEKRTRLRGDGLVPVDSALGIHANQDHCLAFPEAHRSIALGVGHLDLLSAPSVYTTLRDWLTTQKAPS